MQLKERRMRRAIDRPLGIPWPDIEVLEWAVQGRMVRDFDMAARARGAAREGQGMVRLGMGTVGCDIKGNQVRAFLEWARQKKVAVGLIEGPPLANWESRMEWCAAVGWGNTIVEFVTTELGEALARRRKALVVSPNPIDEQSVNHLMVKAVVATPLGAVVNTGKVAEDLVWRFPYKMELVQGAPRDPLLPHVAAHVLWEQGAMRENLHGLTGPGRWPLVQRGQEHYEQLYIYDRAGPSGSARALSFEEIWKAQGRTTSEWKATVASCEGVPVQAFDEGCKGTGARTAETLLAVAAAVACDKGVLRAGAIRDGRSDESLAKLLLWLRRWKQGEFGREGQTRKVGGAVCGCKPWRTKRTSGTGGLEVELAREPKNKPLWPASSLHGRNAHLKVMCRGASMIGLRPTLRVTRRRAQPEHTLGCGPNGVCGPSANNGTPPT